VAVEADPDVQLMLALQRGDLTAFDQLFNKHAPGLIRFATQLVGNRARAEELAQDVFLQVYRNRASYIPSARFVTWLYRMATNACVSEARRSEHRHRVRPKPRPDGEEPHMPEIRTPSAEQDVISQEAAHRLQGVLSKLPTQQRAALLLARVEGMSYEEVALALSTSVAAIKSLVHRATVTLRDQLPDLRDVGES